MGPGLCSQALTLLYRIVLGPSSAQQIQQQNTLSSTPEFQRSARCQESCTSTSRSTQSTSEWCLASAGPMDKVAEAYQGWLALAISDTGEEWPHHVSQGPAVTERNHTALPFASTSNQYGF